MQDRVLTALRQAGIDGRPAATLDKDGAAFALLDDTLLYLEGSEARSVPLRDISRIHSDAAGVLRVETPSGTAITASLVGFDPSRVQHFFNEVKAATTRAKSLPATPGPVPGSSTWKTGWGVGAAVPQANPAATTGADQADAARKTAPVQPVTPIQPTAPAVSATAAPVVPTEEPRRVVISSTPRPSDEPVASAPAPTPRASEERTPDAFTEPRRPLPRIPDVGRFAPTLRLLALLMFVVGAGVGALDWQAGERLAGLWTFGVGAVGAFALYVFAEVVRAIAGIAARVSNDA